MARRINTSTRAIDKFGSGKHGWESGISPPSTSTEGEDVFFDHLQEEIANVVESAGYVVPENEVADRDDMLLSALMVREVVMSLGSYVDVDITGVTLTTIVGKAPPSQYVDFSPDQNERIGLPFIVAGDSATIYAWRARSNAMVTDTLPSFGTDIFGGAWGDTGDSYSILLVGDNGNAWRVQNSFAGSGPQKLTGVGSTTFRCAVYDGPTTSGNWILAGDSGVIYTATVPGVGTIRTSGTGVQITSLANSGSRVLGTLASSSDMIRSDDGGVSWTLFTPTVNPGTDDIRSHVIWNAARSKFFALGDPRSVYESVDGTTWDEVLGTENLLANTVGALTVDSHGIMVASGGSTSGPYVGDGRMPFVRVTVGSQVDLEAKFCCGAWLVGRVSDLNGGGTGSGSENVRIFTARQY